MADSRLYELAAQTGAALQARGLVLATAESCTGGWIGEAITMIPGSSAWYDRGFITYTNSAKIDMLGVKTVTLDTCGAVSAQTVSEMVAGALAASGAGVAVAVSGVAGPGGGTPQKPVGTVCLAWGRKGASVIAQTRHFSGDREAVRRQTVVCALEGLLEMLGGA